ncbi:MAG: type II secretion system protein GspK [Candidatus Sumerlaeia bacterium]|nr:type II secretion system protein GspK [Candidatus Sumerlaeia bacterium]
MTRLRRGRRGFALVVVLWVVAIAMLLLYATIYSAMSEARITSTRKKLVRAEALARAGIGRSIVDQRNDLIYDFAEEGESFDGEGDVWMRPEEGKLEEELVRDGGYFTVETQDLDGLFDLNQMAVATRLPLLKQIFVDIGYNEEDAETAAGSIIDWVDADTTPTGQESTGEEGVYYAILAAGLEGDRRVDEDAVTPLKMPNEPFQTVEQLLDVYGVTPEAYFGADSPELEFYLSSEPARREVGQRFRIENPPRRGRDEPPIGLRDYFTIGNNGRLNVNTAPKHVLAALVGANGVSDGESIAEQTIRKRRGGRVDDFDNKSAYKTAQEVLEDGDLAGALQASAPFYAWDIRSNFARVRSTGYVGDVAFTVTVDTSRGMTNLVRDETFELSDRARDREDRLGRRSERRRDQDNELLVRYPAVRITRWIE